MITDSSVFFHFRAQPLLWPLTRSKEDAEHLKTIKESQAYVLSCWGTIDTATVQRWRSSYLWGPSRNDWCRAMYWSQQGFHSGVRHTSQRIIFPAATGLNSTCVRLTCVTLTWSSHSSCDWPAGAICRLLPQRETDRWFRGKKELTDRGRIRNINPSRSNWYVCLQRWFYTATQREIK